MNFNQWLRPFFGDCADCGAHGAVVELRDAAEKTVRAVCGLHLFKAMFRKSDAKSYKQTVLEAKPEDRTVIMPGDPKYGETRVVLDRRMIEQAAKARA